MELNGVVKALRGHFSAKIDDKGRLKVPTAFRTLVEELYGTALFVTSLTGEYVRIYPLPVWAEKEASLERMPSTHPARGRYLDRVNYYGQMAELDGQGRVVIHSRLRESASMAGDVDVFGHLSYMDVWNHDRFAAKLQREPFTDDDARALADFKV